MSPEPPPAPAGPPDAGPVRLRSEARPRPYLRGRHVGPQVVALGGGHGLSASLGALRRITERLTAVVTVADNGGSSGRLRRDFGVLPPGDLRMALAALCRDDDWGRTWADVLQHRFSAGDLSEHAVGNLLIVALWDLLGDTVEGLDWVGELLGAQGRVLPMASIPLDITAMVLGADAALPDEITKIRGQESVAKTRGQVIELRLSPSDPPASPDALDAIAAADWIVLGPGSWYTSVLPHLLVPELADALRRTKAKRLVTLNLGAPEGETAGLTSANHLEVLAAHAPELAIDVVLADERAAPDGEAVELERACQRLGAELVIARVADKDGSLRHHVPSLTRVYRSILE